MPHGAPDWWKYRRDSTTFSLEDMAEHAVRLGSIHSFDRRGDAVDITSFEDGWEGWRAVAAGTGAFALLSAQRSRWGVYSAHLASDATGANHSWIGRDLAYPVLSRFGFEFSFALGVDIDHIDITLHLLDGVEEHNADYRINVAADSLQYADAAGVWRDALSTLKLSTNDRLWHTLKLLVNYPAAQYERLIYDNRTASLHGIAYQRIANASAPQMGYAIALWPAAAKSGSLYLDAIIITQDEL